MGGYKGGENGEDFEQNPKGGYKGPKSTGAKTAEDYDQFPDLSQTGPESYGDDPEAGGRTGG